VGTQDAYPPFAARILPSTVVGIPEEEIGGHSLRAGFATQATMNGATELQIMQQPGYRSLAMVRRYIREGSLFRDNAAGKLGL
jgi:hypothetical protein